MIIIILTIQKIKQSESVQSSTGSLSLSFFFHWRGVDIALLLNRETGDKKNLHSNWHLQWPQKWHIDFNKLYKRERETIEENNFHVHLWCSMPLLWQRHTILYWSELENLWNLLVHSIVYLEQHLDEMQVKAWRVFFNYEQKKIKWFSWNVRWELFVYVPFSFITFVLDQQLAKLNILLQ